jgi:Collagen triple helix repeat (20 copies)
MMNRPPKPVGHEGRRRWPSPSMVAASLALFVALGGTAVAANSLIQAKDIAAGAVTSKAIKNGAVGPKDLSTSTRALIQTGGGLTGATGAAGAGGTNGANGAPGTAGAPGTNGANGPNGVDGVDGTNGTNGANGPNGANGANGVDGDDGANGLDGVDGTDGTDGIDGTVTPLSAKQGLTALPTASPPTTVVSLTVPPGNYVVLAKTQLSHTGAGDSIDCTLKSGATVLDQVAMKTLPALAAIPVPLQAVTTTISSSVLSVECDVMVANGSADFSSLIAIPTA